MLIGDSGTGKTGALASLVLAGYNLKVWDFDNGLDILVGVLRQKAAGDEAKLRAWLSQIQYQTLTDRMKAINNRLVPIQAVAWQNATAYFEKWPDGGNIEQWGPKDIAVIDSLTFAGKAAMRWIQQLNGRLSVAPQIQDYWDAQRLVEGLCATLYDASIKCNVLVLSHIREVGKSETKIITDNQGRQRPVTVTEEGSKKGYAETGTGNALSPNIGRYFNSVLMVDIIGSGMGVRRQIITQPSGNIGLKNPAPGVVKREYPLETGLAEYFAAVRSEPAAKAAS
jgi:hypothetical protein